MFVVIQVAGTSQKSVGICGIRSTLLILKYSRYIRLEYVYYIHVCNYQQTYTNHMIQKMRKSIKFRQVSNSQVFLKLWLKADIKLKCLTFSNKYINYRNVVRRKMNFNILLNIRSRQSTPN